MQFSSSWAIELLLLHGRNWCLLLVVIGVCKSYCVFSPMFGDFGSFLLVIDEADYIAAMYSMI